MSNATRSVISSQTADGQKRAKTGPEIGPNHCPRDVRPNPVDPPYLPKVFEFITAILIWPSHAPNGEEALVCLQRHHHQVPLLYLGGELPELARPVADKIAARLWVRPLQCLGELAPGPATAEVSCFGPPGDRQPLTECPDLALAVPATTNQPCANRTFVPVSGQTHLPPRPSNDLPDFYRTSRPCTCPERLNSSFVNARNLAAGDRAASWRGRLVVGCQCSGSCKR